MFTKGKLDTTLLKKLVQIQQNPPHMFCIEDGSENTHSTEDKVLRDFLEMMYPKSAPWEKKQINHKPSLRENPVQNRRDQLRAVRRERFRQRLQNRRQQRAARQRRNSIR